jgi:AcrR family transcriptional regulator
MNPTPTRTGRRPGDSRTRRAILDAARAQFGDRGYAETTIRAIADEAHVDPALVMHFFGSKDRLFVACVEWPFDPAREIPAVIGDGPEGAGARLTALFLRTWDERAGRNTIVALLRAAMTQEPARRELREFLEAEILMPLLAGLESDRAAVRGNLVASQLIGLGVVRHVLEFEPLASMQAADVVDLVAPGIQAALTDPLPPAR